MKCQRTPVSGTTENNEVESWNVPISLSCFKHLQIIRFALNTQQLKPIMSNARHHFLIEIYTYTFDFWLLFPLFEETIHLDFRTYFWIIWLIFLHYIYIYVCVYTENCIFVKIFLAVFRPKVRSKCIVWPLPTCFINLIQGILKTIRLFALAIIINVIFCRIPFTFCWPKLGRD